MKKYLLACLILCVGLYSKTAAQDNGGDIPVYQREGKELKQEETFTFAYKKGDKIVLNFTVEKEKNIKSVKLQKFQGSTIWEQSNTTSLNQEFTINEDGVYSFVLTPKMGKRKINMEITRKPADSEPFNTAFMQHNIITSEEFEYTVDSAIGYAEAVKSEKQLKVFDQYIYGEHKFHNNTSGQVLGNLDGKCMDALDMKMTPSVVPENARIKSYNYSIESVLGGASHWEIAEIGTTVAAGVASLFLTPAAGFAISGSMVFLAPCEDYNTTMCFFSNRWSDKDVARNIYFHGDIAEEASDLWSGITGGSKSQTLSEKNMDFDQKGQIANLYVTSAKPSVNPYLILVNSYSAQARNWKFNSSVVFYAPRYKMVNAVERKYGLKTVPVPKKTTKYSQSVIYLPIDN